MDQVEDYMYDGDEERMKEWVVRYAAVINSPHISSTYPTSSQIWGSAHQRGHTPRWSHHLPVSLPSSVPEIHKWGVLLLLHLCSS